MVTKLVTDICKVCNREFSFYPSAYDGGRKLFCSRKCFSRSRRVDTTCPQCGKEFWYHQSWPRIRCSRKCSGAVTVMTNLGIKELPPMFCEQCGDELTGQKYKSKRFCSRKCFGRYLSATRKGVPRPEVSGPKPHLRRRVEKTCLQCNAIFSVKQSRQNKAKYCSKTCSVQAQRESSAAISGPNNFNWKGGYDPYYGPNWKKQRRYARHRDKYACQRCGITEEQLGSQLHVHHIKPRRTFNRDFRRANRLSNLISLCLTCHLMVEPRA